MQSNLCTNSTLTKDYVRTKTAETVGFELETIHSNDTSHSEKRID